MDQYKLEEGNPNSLNEVGFVLIRALIRFKGLRAFVPR